MGHIGTGYLAMWHRQSRGVVPAVMLLAAGLPGANVAAQDAAGTQDRTSTSLPGAPLSDAVCDVRADSRIMPAIGSANLVIAICGGRGLLLGHADRFETHENKELGAVLVTLHRGSEQRVLLVSLHEDGPPLLEDLGGQIALAAGRGAMSPIDGIAIDTRGFTREGTIAVTGEATRGEHTAERTIALAPQIAQARASRLRAAEAIPSTRAE